MFYLQEVSEGSSGLSLCYKGVKRLFLGRLAQLRQVELRVVENSEGGGAPSRIPTSSDMTLHHVVMI